MESKDKTENGILRDESGRFLPQTAPGPGRPALRPNKLTVLKGLLVDAFFEENGVDKFRQMLRSPLKFESALKLLLSFSSKTSYEVYQDSDGKKSIKIIEEGSDGARTMTVGEQQDG